MGKDCRGVRGGGGGGGVGGGETDRLRKNEAGRDRKAETFGRAERERRIRINHLKR